MEKKPRTNNQSAGTTMLAIGAAAIVIVIWICAAGRAALALRSSQNGLSAGVAADALVGGYMDMKYALINLNGRVRHFLGQRLANGSVRLDNDQMVFTWEEPVDVSENAQRVIRLKDVTDETGSALVFGLVPRKNTLYRDQFPAGIEDHVDEVMGAMDEQLRAGGVDTVGFIPALRETQAQGYPVYFRTDYHWTPEAGLAAARTVAQRLNQEYGFSIDLSKLDMEQFNREVYKECYLGYDALRIGAHYVGLDDISLLYPRYETDMTLYVPDENIVERGAFQELTFDYDKIKSKDYFRVSKYTAYRPVLYGYAVHINHTADNDDYILLVAESYSLVVEPYLSLGVRRVDILDLRSYRDMSLEAYIRKNRPDAVVFLYNPGAYDTDNELMDFFD